MSPIRSFALLAVAGSIAGCATTHPRPATAPPEITVDLSVTPATARDRVTAAFNAYGLPVATSQPGVVEFHAMRERGILGQYEVFARAVIVPIDCGTRITMFGEETKFPSATSMDGTATRIGPSSKSARTDFRAIPKRSI